MPSTNWFRFNHPNTSADGISSGFYLGKYTISDFCVTEGEDHDLQIGQLREFSHSDDGWLSFEINRSGSTDTARWWKNRVADAECTFHHGPDKLNFAMKGTLVLYFDKPDPSNGRNEIVQMVFENFFLAQGHSGTTNNWWVGALYATQGLNAGDILVKNTDGRVVTFTRGGSDQYVDRVDVLV